MFLPFYIGAAAMAVLFPLFIIISCTVSPTERSQHGASGAKLWSKHEATTKSSERYAS